ncbi:MAG: hypothetical protein H6581_24280 [Bacteroidia bacterium]|nr:hypothetical protein [Bacteroidia bacterium]
MKFGHNYFWIISDFNVGCKVTKTEIIQEAHYYPGACPDSQQIGRLELQGLDTPQIGSQHRWLFNGKENQTDFGLNLKNGEGIFLGFDDLPDTKQEKIEKRNEGEDNDSRVKPSQTNLQPGE